MPSLIVFIASVLAMASSTDNCHVHVPAASDRRQCEADGFWYSCAECSGGSRPCFSDSGLNQCACAPLMEHCRVKPFFKYTKDMYPPVNDILRNFDPDNETMTAMTPLSIHEGAASAAPPRRFAIAASVFCAQGNYHFKEGQSCLSRFVAPLTENVHKATKRGFDVVLYVSREMKKTVRAACASCSLHVMPEDHRHGTASIWRFQAANLEQYEFVAMTDLDEPWDWIFRWQAAVAESGRSQAWAWGRMLPSRASDFRIATQSPVSALNYATMIASHLIAQPRNMKLDIRDAVARFVSLRHAAATTSHHPWRSAPDEKDTLFNLPIGEHVHGWGNVPAIYGFDESFLKRVVYPHCVQRGQLVTFDSDDAHGSFQGGGPTGKPGENAYVEADLAFVYNFKGNEVIQMKWRRLM